MGSEVNPTKKRFDDLSMSRRTRKPLNNHFKETQKDISIAKYSPTETPPHQLIQHHQDQEDEKQDRELERKHDEVQEPKQDQEVEQKEYQEQQEQERKQNQEQEGDRKSLNQLIKHEEESKVRANKSSLGEQFSEEEKHMQIVRKMSDKKGGENGVKFRGMIGRYVKVLSSLIKANSKHSGQLSSSKKRLIVQPKT